MLSSSARSRLSFRVSGFPSGGRRRSGGGVVIAGEITLAVADVDLVHVSLRALVSSVETARPK